MTSGCRASYLHIAEVLQLPERQEQEQHHVVAAVQRWLASHQDWLLIGDNVDNADALQSLLSVGGQGAILLTAQQQALGTGAAVSITLPPLADEEGIMLLLRRGKVAGSQLAPESVATLSDYSSGDYLAAQQLVELLGALPLALDQAGAYIEEAGCGVADYLERFEQQRAQLLARRGNVTSNHPHSVLTTILLASQRVAHAQPNALYLLRLCTFLHADAIPEELFLTAASEKPLDPLPPFIADRLSLRYAPHALAQLILGAAPEWNTHALAASARADRPVGSNERRRTLPRLEPHRAVAECLLS